MTIENQIAIIAAYDDLVMRAIEITRGPPFHMYCDEERHARIVVVGDAAKLSWPEWASGYYAGEGNIETQSVRFPAALLLLSAEELAKWKTEQDCGFRGHRSSPIEEVRTSISYEDYQKIVTGGQ